MKKDVINSELDEENDLLFFTIAGNLHKGQRQKGKQYHLKGSVLGIANVQKRVLLQVGAKFLSKSAFV